MTSHSLTRLLCARTTRSCTPTRGAPSAAASARRKRSTGETALIIAHGTRDRLGADFSRD